jgi:hypothetical protein
VFRGESGDRGDLFLGGWITMGRKLVSVRGAAGGDDEPLEITGSANGKPVCVPFALDPIGMRHALGAEGERSGPDPDGLAASDEDAQLALEDIPNFIVGLVEMEGRHVPRPPCDLDYGHAPRRFLWQPDVHEVGEEPAGFCVSVDHRPAIIRLGPELVKADRQRHGVIGLIDSILPAAEVVRRIVDEAEEILRTRLPSVLSSG